MNTTRGRDLVVPPPLDMDVSVVGARSPTVDVVPGGTTARDYIAFKVDADDREVCAYP